MTRTWAALAVSAVAIGVLLALIYSSRPLGTDVYERHHQRLNAIASSASTYNSLLEQLRAGRREGASIGGAIGILRSRLEQNGQAVAASARDAGLDAAPYQTYSTALGQVLTNTVTAEEQLRGMQRALAVLREEGPAAVQRLRETSGGLDAERFYSLWLRVFEYGRGGAADKAELERQIVEMQSGDTPMATRLLDMVNAMESVVAIREPLDATIASIEGSGFAEAASALANHYRGAHASQVTARNNARVLVSLYSLLLFAGLGFLGYRLHGSYRELNEANEQLQMVNADLERRVEERTRDVQKAYTDLQQSQVQLVQAEKMSSLGQLVAGISHEINTPLLYLQSNATINKETLLRISAFIDECHNKLLPSRRPGESHTEARQRFVEGLKDLQRALVDDEIREELREVMALTEDNLEGLEELTQLAQGLKDFSRLDRAPVENFNVNDGVERTLIIAKNMLKTRIRVHTDLGQVPDITCAPSQINQVLLNIITNASQAIEGEGELFIKTYANDGHVVVRIRDTGTGIDPEIMARIRDPFFTTKEVGSGTGLGLSIVEEILSKHNGRLEIDSTVGHGATFTVYLPIGRSATELADALAAGPAEPDEAEAPQAAAPAAANIYNDLAVAQD